MSYPGAADWVKYKFNPQGKFITRFPAITEAGSDSTGGNSLAIDGQGRIFVSSGSSIAIFSPDGRSLKAFEPGSFADRIQFTEGGELLALARDQVTRYKLQRDLP